MSIGLHHFCDCSQEKVLWRCHHREPFCACNVECPSAFKLKSPDVSAAWMLQGVSCSNGNDILCTTVKNASCSTCGLQQAHHRGMSTCRLIKYLQPSALHFPSAGIAQLYHHQFSEPSFLQICFGHSSEPAPQGPSASIDMALSLHASLDLQSTLL